VIVDARRRTTRHVHFSCSAITGSFSPDSRGVAIQNDCGAGGSLVFVRIDGSGKKAIASNSQDPVWGQGGLAFATFFGISRAETPSDSLRLLTRIGGRPRTLLKRQLPNVFPISWSANGRELLAMKAQHPLLITPSKRQVRMLSVQVTELDMLSRDGRFVLGVMDGNLVSVRSDTGAVTVLAQDGLYGSWTK